MTPEPSVEAGCSRGNWSPKKKRNRGSSVSRPCGRATDALENILTTAGMALCAASAKERPGGARGVSVPGGASCSAMPGANRRRFDNPCFCNHCGLSAAMMNRSARSTVTDCANSSPNGLQVEGQRDIRKLATGVTASRALLEAALAWGADAALVHHGFFWKNEPLPIRGWKYQRLRLLLANGMHLFAYHLPLDAHPELGNNAQLGQRLGVCAEGRFGDQELGWTGSLPEPVTLAAFSAQVNDALGRAPLALGDAKRSIRRVAWCTGAAQSFFSDAIQAGADLYLSGEVSESTTHLARESGVAYLAAGHHATERYGVQALGQHLADRFGFEHRFIDIDNPV